VSPVWQWELWLHISHSSHHHITPHHRIFCPFGFVSEVASRYRADVFSGGMVWKSSDFRNGQLDVQQRKKDVKTEIDNTLCAFALNWKTTTQIRKDAMAQRTKISWCISLEFLIVPFLVFIPTI